MNTNKHYRINWSKGMRLTHSILTQNDAYTDYQFLQTRKMMLGNNSYGLFPQINQTLFALQSDVKNNQFHLQRLVCKAITPSGYLIDINTDIAVDKEENPIGHCEIPSTGNDLDLYIVVNPFKQIPIGNPDPMDVTATKPYKEIQYELCLIASGNETHFQKENACLLGRYQKQGMEFVRNESFIPPSIAISSHGGLRNIAYDFQQQLSSLYHQLIQKKQMSNQTEFIHTMLISINPLVVELENEYEDKSPVDLFVLMKKVAASIRLASQICDIALKDENQIFSFLNTKYEHEHIFQCLSAGINTLQWIQKEVDALENIVKPEPEPVPEPEPEQIPEPEPRIRKGRGIDLSKP